MSTTREAQESVQRLARWVEFDQINQPGRNDDSPLAISYERHPLTRGDLVAVINLLDELDYPVRLNGQHVSAVESVLTTDITFGSESFTHHFSSAQDMRVPNEGGRLPESIRVRNLNFVVGGRDLDAPETLNITASSRNNRRRWFMDAGGEQDASLPAWVRDVGMTHPGVAHILNSLTEETTP